MHQNSNLCVTDPQLCVIGSTEISFLSASKLPAFILVKPLGLEWGGGQSQTYSIIVCLLYVCVCVLVEGGGGNKGGKQQSWLMHSDDRHSLFLLRTRMLPVSCSHAQNANVFYRCSFAGRFICCKVGILTLSARLYTSFMFISLEVQIQTKRNIFDSDLLKVIVDSSCDLGNIPKDGRKFLEHLQQK